VPLDTQTILGSVAKTHRLLSASRKIAAVRLGPEIMSIIAVERSTISTARWCASPRRIVR